VPARWLARLDALFGHEPGKGRVPEYMQRAQRSYLAWAAELDRPAAYKPWPRPAPVPPLEARPDKLSVSGIELLRRDPYGAYARYILRLSKLDALEEKLGAADRGNALHEALDEFMTAHPSGILPDGAVREFEALGEHHLADLLSAPAERAFWWPRFRRLARWLIATENERRAAGSSVLKTETDGTLTVGSRGRELVITARADRIDRVDAETWEVIDYKTGRPPSPEELDALFAPQLLLEAAMAERGGFTEIKGKRPKSVRLSYWQANGQGDGGKVTEVKDSDALIADMIDLAGRMADHFGRKGTAYTALPWPDFGPYFNNYEHLERVDEWSTAGGDT
jgi:ATP-dependent helicase/nuclease subunit B